MSNPENKPSSSLWSRKTTSTSYASKLKHTTKTTKFPQPTNSVSKPLEKIPYVFKSFPSTLPVYSIWDSLEISTTVPITSLKTTQRIQSAGFPLVRITSTVKSIKSHANTSKKP
jgi:hypothetical protein